MSMRPRPVTATVTKPRWMEPYAVRPPSISMDSTGSTASLTSVLDHDSYISPAPSDEEWVEDDTYKSRSEEEDSKYQENDNFCENFQNKANIKSKLAEFEDSSDPLTESSPAEEKLSPWEKWLIAKTKSERQKRKQKIREKKDLKVQEKEIIKQKVESEKKAEVIRKVWLQEKNLKERERKKAEKRRVQMEKELKEDEERRIAQKAEQIYKDWKASKNKELREKQRSEIRKKEEEEAKKEEQKKKAEEKYRKWCLQAKSRPKSAQSSFGYTSGKLTGYHDTNAYPAPSFCNPIPWHHIPVPRPKSEKSKTRPNKPYKWNPHKYF